MLKGIMKFFGYTSTREANDEKAKLRTMYEERLAEKEKVTNKLRAELNSLKNKEFSYTTNSPVKPFDSTDYSKKPNTNNDLKTYNKSSSSGHRRRRRSKKPSNIAAQKNINKLILENK